MDKNFSIELSDCLEFMRGMVERGDRVDAIVTDPPYLYLKHKIDRPFDEREFFELASKITDKIVFFGRGDSFYRWNLLCEDFGFEFKEEIVWDKGLVSNPMGRLGRVHETISVRIKGDEKLNRVKVDYIKYAVDSRDLKRVIDDVKRIKGSIKNKRLLDYIDRGERVLVKSIVKHGITRSDGYEYPREIKTIEAIENGILIKSIVRENREHRSMEHPTQKPINLLRKLILLVSDRGDIIFDPFMGSGSTGVASIIEGRKFVGCEIDTEYFEVSNRRISETDKTLRQSLFYGLEELNG